MTFRLLLIIQTIRSVISQSYFCSQDKQNVFRYENKIQLILKSTEVFLKLSGQTQLLTASSQIFEGMSKDYCKIISNNCQLNDGSSCPSDIFNNFNCDLDGNKLTLKLWDNDLLKNSFTTLYIEVGFLQQLSIQVPDMYTVAYNYTLNSISQNQCSTLYSIQPSSPESLSMQFSSPTTSVVVQTSEKIQIQYKPKFDTKSDSIQIMINQQQYYLDFYNVFQSRDTQIWSTSVQATVIPGLTIFTKTSNCNPYSKRTQYDYYCLQLNTSPSFTFSQNTTYTITISNLNYPFHPLGFADLQLKVMQSQKLYEWGSVNNGFTPQNFTPLKGTQALKSIQFCTTSNACTQTGLALQNYNKVSITVSNPAFLAQGSTLTIIFNMDFILFDSTDTNKAVQISFAQAQATFKGSFVLNTPTTNQMSAIFKISPYQIITDNDMTIQISNAFMGFEMRDNYQFQLNADCSSSLSSSSQTARQYEITFNTLSLSSNIFKTLAIDDQTPFQIGLTSTYKFNITPSNPFTSSKIWINVTFPSTFQILEASTSCYTVVLNGSTNINSNTIIEKTRSSTVVKLEIPFSSTQKVSIYSVSICKIQNPAVTGTSDNIQVAAYYVNESNLSENGTTSTTITPAQFAIGTSIAPKNETIKETMASNGYTFTLNLPVPQKAGNILKIVFPNYLANNISFYKSNPTFINQITNLKTSPVSWQGSLSSDTSSSITITFEAINPPLTQTTYTFTALMSDSSNKPQLSSNIILSTTIYTPGNFNLVNKNRISTINGDPTTYTFTIQTHYYMEPNSNFFLRIQLDSTQTVTNLSVNELTNNLNPATLTAKNTNDGSNNYIDITSTLSSNFAYQNNYIAKFTFSIKTITNYRSTKPLNSLQIISGVSLNSLGCSSTYSWDDNTVKPLNQNSVQLKSIEKQYFEQPSIYSFQISFDIPIPLNGYFVVTGSQNFPNNVSIQSNPSLMFNLDLAEQNKLRIKCIQQTCQTFILIINPINNPTYTSFQNSKSPVLNSLITYDNASPNGYIIQSIQFNLDSINYFNECYTISPFTSYCKDCKNQNQNFCTSCYSDAVFGGQTFSLLDTINNVCVQTCPITQYDNGKSQCVKCINNCETCSSATTCISCVSPYLQQGTSCQAQCNPTFYADSNRRCQKCDQTKCLNCSISSTNCTSCQTGLGLITSQGGSSCINCSQTPGYFDKQDNSGQCGVCNPLCASCSGNANNCSTCVQISNGQAVYHNPITNTCTTSCEKDGYNLLQDSNSFVCGICSNSCKTCKNQASFCTSCNSPLYLQQNKCVAKSEIIDGFYANDVQRTADPCPQVCTKCVSASICTFCISNFFLDSGSCLSSCPTAKPIPDGQGGCKEDTAAKVSNISEDSKVVPFPMLLACIAFCISIYFSKYEYHATFVPGCIVGFCSLFEWISWIVLIAATADYSGMQSSAAILALLGFLFLYFVNVFQFILVKKYIEADSVFIEWVLNNQKNKLCFTVIKYASLIISFKASRIIFSKYFNQGFFKAKLTSIDIFSSFNKLAIVSVLINSSLIIVSSTIATYTYAKQSQGFFLGLDSLIVTIMMIIFMIWDSLKKKDFFEEPIDLNQTFSQRFLPFDQSYMDRMHSRVLDNSARMNRGESNSSLADFKESKKVTIQEGLQKPMQQVLDPSEMSANATIDKNVLKNSENGAFYLIQDHLYESYKPGPNGGKRYFEKQHIAPQFDYSKYNPIQEHSNEDELDEDDEHMDLKNKQGQYLFDQSRIVKESSMGNQRAIKPNRNFDGNQYQDEEEPVPQKPNTRHTIYYNENIQGMLNSVSTKGIGNNSQLQNQEGVSIGVNMNQEEDEENQELRQRLYSKPSDIINGDQALAGAMMMRQSYSPQQSKLQNNSNHSKTEGNRQSIKNNSTLNNSPSNKFKKKTSTSRSRSISPSLAKTEDKKMKKSNSPKKLKSQISDDENYNNNNMRNSQTSNKSAKSNKSKNSPKKGKSNDEDSMLFYFAHPVDGDQALPPNQNSSQRNKDDKKNKNNQGKGQQNENKDSNNQNQNNGNQNGVDINDDNRVERIMPIEENLDEPYTGQRQVQAKYDLANQMKMKGPYNNDRIKATKGGLMGVENEDDSEDLQGRSKGLNNQGSQDIDRNIYDSSESVRTAEEADINYNEVSPSDFNVLNQRYEEDFFAIQLQQQIQRQQQLSGNNLMINPDIQSIQMGSVIQSPSNQLLQSQQAQLMGGSLQSRPPLMLANSNSNISIANPKTTKSAGGGKKKSKNKTRSSSKNHPNLSSQNNPFNHAVIHQGLMTPSSGSVHGMRNGQGFMQQDIDPMNQNSPAGSHRTGRGTDNYHSSQSRNIRPNSQEQSDGYMRSNTQNMYQTSNSKNSNPMGSKLNGGGSRTGNISPSSSNQVITYKVPQTDINKLKSLEKIYLQRLEIQGGNNNAQSSSKKPKKNKQHQSNNIPDFSNDFDQNSVRSSQVHHNMNQFFKPDSRQAKNSSDIHTPSAILMDDPNSMVIADFGDEIYKD